MPLILVIADDRPVRRFVSIVLGANGCDVLEAENLAQGLGASRRRQPQLIVAEADMVRGVLSAQAGGSWGGLVPAIMVSALGRPAVQRTDLAQVPIVPPFVASELLAQVGNSLGLAGFSGRADVLQAGNLRVDLTRRLVAKAGQTVRLSEREFEVLLCLAANPDRAIADARILRAIWGAERAMNRRLLRGYIEKLRKKLENCPFMPRVLMTEAGVGYRLRLRSAGP